MNLFTRTQPVPVKESLVERHAGASALAAYALGTFHDVANDLDAAAAAHAAVVSDAMEEIAALEGVLQAADLAAEAHALSARKVRSLFGL